MTAASAARPSRHAIETKTVKRCWENEAFRREFTADPALCFVKHLNAPKAQLPQIVLHQEGPGSWHIVLPAKPAKADQLSDEELERVAGGTDVIFTVGAVVSLSMAVGGYEGLRSGW